jgi:Flp pilus assembly pilin Flp
MKVMIRFLRRIVRDIAGTPATEWAVFLMLVAAVAGFGMLVLGDALAAIYSDISTLPWW